MPVSKDDLISQREASRRFCVAPATLRRRMRRGELATFQNPLDQRAVLFRVADLESLTHPRPREARKETAASAV